MAAVVRIVIEAADQRMASVELARLARVLAGPGRRKPTEANRPRRPETRPRFDGEEPPLAIFEGLR